MLVEATLEFEEESPDFEIHIVWDDDPHTPEEDPEIQPDEEEEEKFVHLRWELP